MAGSRTIIVGAGVGGLSAALALAAQGHAVTVLERAAAPGGKMRVVEAGGAAIDSGPTVFTMRWVFDELFGEAGERLEDHLALRPLEVLARHAWSASERLDLFADPARSEDAIGQFAGAAEARGFRDFSARARRIYEALERPFIRAERPTPFSLVASAGPFGLMGLWGVSPFATMWKALGEHFRDPRLRQLFGRYATYTGSSPYLAPATLMLIAHVEQAGVWTVEGGMHRVARALEGVAAAHGARFRYGAHVAEILVERGRAAGVRLADGERIAGDAVMLNADAAALAGGLFGVPASRAAERANPADRSLSAVTWSMLAEAEGFPLVRHSVFFSRDYAAEFDRILAQRRLPEEPTVYVCAQDRNDEGTAPGGPERLLVLVNAPPTGDRAEMETEPCRKAAFALMERCGLRLTPRDLVQTTPRDFEALFPATGGALYGRANHGWAASFARPGSRTSLPGLYLAGGSAHPGAGVPMAALSGRLAAASISRDLASTARSRGTAMSGGTSTR
ncbi:MAG TPA: phytoene desaturase family protein [Acetobacteraceae bacterium]|nr:phytoene desaturase family protein [Acetobacteraceae bacterium]